ncbi:ribosome hibernation-promoting factor, HPF/YfiA family [Bacteroidota bacterium]
MKTQVHSIGFDADKKLIRFINKKIDKLSRFSDDIIDAEVFLKVESSQNNENKLAEIKLKIRGSQLFAKEQSRTFEGSIDSSCIALRRQLTKRKEKLRGV